MFNFKHLEETNTTYYEHFSHGLEAGAYLLLCSLTCLIDFIFANVDSNLKSKRRRAVARMFIDLSSRWSKLETKNYQESKNQKLEKTLFEQQLLIEKYIPSPNNRINYIIQSKEYFMCSTSSIIHAFFPEILVDDAAKGLIRIYLKVKHKGY